MPDRTRQGPEVHAFHRTILHRTLALTAGVTGLIGLAGLTGRTVIPWFHTLANVIFCLGCLGLLAALRRFPAAHVLLARLFLAGLFGLITLATVFISDDPLRVTWYFAAAGAAFLLQGPAAGLIVAAAASVAVLVLAFLGVFALTPVVTFIAAIWATSAAFATFSMQARNLIGAMSDAANRDPLTGLANRRVFEASFARLCTGANSFALIMADVDHFKILNDTHGHAAGDAVLAGVASTLALAVRGEDLVARIGGEEFAVLLPGVGMEEGRSVAERLRAAVAAAGYPVTESQTLQVTISLGVAASAPPHPGKAVFLQADAALYQAKRAGRNRVMHAAG